MNRSKRRVVIFGQLLFYMFICFIPARAQAIIEAQFRADTGTPLIGQPVTLTLTATLPQGIGIVGWPEFSEVWGDFDVRSIDELSITQNPDGTALYEQTLTVSLWAVGDFQTPDTTIQYQVISEGETRAQTIVPAFFSVPSVLDPADLTLRPPKPPITLPYVPPLLIAGIAAAGLAVTAIAIVQMWKPRPARIPQAQGIMTPAKSALAELRRIAGRNLSPVLIYQSVADALRVYTQSQYNVQAMDMTTWELLNALRTYMPEASRADLQRLLEQADLVKFARYDPDATSAQRYLDMAGHWLKIQDDVSEVKS